MGQKSNWRILEDWASTTMRHLIIAFAFPVGSCLRWRLPLVFSADGISLGLDSFQNAIQSLTTRVALCKKRGRGLLRCAR